MNRGPIFALLLSLVFGFGPAPAAADTLASVVAGDHRTETERRRDEARNPVETLRWIGIRDDMTVVEILPGGGWYTAIIAPFLRDRGVYYAAGYDPDSPTDFMRNVERRFRANVRARSALYGEVRHTVLDPPHRLEIAPPESADLVLTFRNVHNWMAAGTAPGVFDAMYLALRPGGILGVVEHRASPDADPDPKARSGYVHEAQVVALAEAAGFRLVGRAEINANPRDTRDHPRGVWTLPPTLALGEQDRDRYLAIGESDRMTLKFVKPEEGTQKDGT